MPKDWFSLDKLTALKEVPQGAKIHFIGVCGVAMGQLAVMLANRGYEVSGSDKEFYEPMGSFLKNSSVSLCHGYDAENIPTDVALIVIGNAISYGHPEVSRIEEQSLPYTCFPRILKDTVIQDKHSIVVSGTHGKSTTSAMIAATLVKMDKDPAYFIGAVAPELPNSLHSGTDNISVVEGDEYDDVFFSKQAKFLHYSPTTAIINAIEFDHADLYPDLDAIVKAFENLVKLLPDTGHGICCTDFPMVHKLVDSWAELTSARCITFGENSHADYQIIDWQQSQNYQTFQVKTKDNQLWNYKLPLVGKYNARNAVAATIAGQILGCNPKDFIFQLEKYQPVKRRQQIHISNEQFVLIEDFAHHPTSVAATVSAVKQAYPERELWAVFEPRSNTSRRKIFEAEYLKAFNQADQVILAEVTQRTIDADLELLDVTELANMISKSGTPAIALPNAESIKETIVKAHNGAVVLLMSNGAFGGLPQMLVEEYS